MADSLTPSQNKLGGRTIHRTECRTSLRILKFLEKILWLELAAAAYNLGRLAKFDKTISDNVKYV